MDLDARPPHQDRQPSLGIMPPSRDATRLAQPASLTLFAARHSTEPAAALVEVCGRALHLGNELNSGHRVFGTSTLPPNLTL